MIRIATRGSVLARTQSQAVAEALAELTGEACELVVVPAEGDDPHLPLAAGGPGAFTTTLRAALVQGRADIAVHSFKDLPSQPEPGLVVAAVPPRAVPFDALVATAKLAELPAGTRVGTSSPRRAAGLRRARPDLVVVGVRGNIDTRLRKVAAGEVDALVLAAAGLERLGRLATAVEVLDPAVILPAPAQGALAVECRLDDPLAAEVARLDDRPSRLAVAAERAVLRGIRATCTTAIGALARLAGDQLTLTAELSEHAGVSYAQASGTTPVREPSAAEALGTAEALGLRVAAALLLSGERR